MKSLKFSEFYKGQFEDEGYELFPSSWDWIIELWTKEECISSCKSEFSGRDLDKIEIEAVEPYMIAKFEPLYNVTHAGGRHEDPLTTEKLDTIYKDLFG